MSERWWEGMSQDNVWLKLKETEDTFNEISEGIPLPLGFVSIIIIIAVVVLVFVTMLSGGMF